MTTIDLSTYEPLDVKFKVPELIFESSDISTKKNSKMYYIKSEDDAVFFISEYNENQYDSLFKSDSYEDYWVEFLKNNMVMVHSTGEYLDNNKKLPDKFLIYEYGWVMEVVKFEEKYYLIEIGIDNSEISRAYLANLTRYLEEFNKLNKLKPLMLGA